MCRPPEASANLPAALQFGEHGFLWVEGVPNKDFQQTEGRGVTPHYFEAMEIPLIAGRYFTDADATAATDRPIINQKFAATYFPNRNPIGGRISTDEKHAQWSTVVGVVADVRHMSLEEEPQPQMYDASYDFGDESVAVRSTLPPATVAERDSRHTEVHRPEYCGDRYSYDGRSGLDRHRAAAFSDLAADRVCRDCVDHGAGGIVGVDEVLSESAHARGGYTHGTGSGAARCVAAHPEKCLGAGGLGAGLGLACTWIATRLLKSFLFGVGQHDPFTVVTVSVLLMVCGLMAAFVPARRAASIDPMQALRTE